MNKKIIALIAKHPRYTLDTLSFGINDFNKDDLSDIEICLVEKIEDQRYKEVTIECADAEIIMKAFCRCETSRTFIGSRLKNNKCQTLNPYNPLLRDWNEITKALGLSKLELRFLAEILEAA